MCVLICEVSRLIAGVSNIFDIEGNDALFLSSFPSLLLEVVDVCFYVF